MNELTPTQLEIIRLLAADFSFGQAGLRLGYRPQTVRNKLNSARRILGVSTYRLVALYVDKYGLPE